MRLSTRRTRKVRSKVAKSKSKVAKGKRGGAKGKTAKGKTAKGKRGGAKGKGKRKVSRGKAVRANKSRRRITRKRFSKRGGTTDATKRDIDAAMKERRQQKLDAAATEVDGEDEKVEEGGDDEKQRQAALEEGEGEGEEETLVSTKPLGSEVQQSVGDAEMPGVGDSDKEENPLFPPSTPQIGAEKNPGGQDPEEREPEGEMGDGNIPDNASARDSFLAGHNSADALGVSESPNKKKKCCFEYTEHGDGKIEVDGINCNDAETTDP